MNYPNSAIIDIEALAIALKQQSASLPSELQHQLTTTANSNQLDSDRVLRDLIRSYPPLENTYMGVIQKWDGEYSAQERAKSITATFPAIAPFDSTPFQTILLSHDWVRSSQQLASKRTTTTKQPEWIRRGNTIVTMISGGAFLGVLLAQIPGAILGAIAAGLFGWYSSKPKAE